MNIIELAEEHFGKTIGKYQTELGLDEDMLQAFATAVIENYKAGLVPVAWQCRSNQKQNIRDGAFLTMQPIYTESPNYEATPLYALPLGETK